MSLPVLKIHTDGASRGNPGPAAYGYVLDKSTGERVEEGDCLGNMTNNEAEYTALVRALEHAVQLGTDCRVEIFSDSELMVKQVNRVYRVKKAELRPLCDRVQDLMGGFSEAKLTHVRREQNRRADELCNEALDGKRDATTPAPSSSDLRAQALKCLSAARASWSAGENDALTPQDVWNQLCDLLIEHRVIQRPI